MKATNFQTYCVLVAIFTLLAGFFIASSPAVVSEGGNAYQNPSHGVKPIPRLFAPTVTVTAPNGGEVYTAGTYVNITWTASGGNGTLTVDIRYSVTGKSGPLFLIQSGVSNNGTFMWRIPNAPSTDCYVNITVKDSDVPPQLGVDDSNNPFTILPLPLQVYVLTPDGGENWTIGQTKNIGWCVKGGSGTLTAKLEYSIDNGATYTVIDPGVVGKTTYSWSVPIIGTTSSQCLVQITITDSSPTPQVQPDTSNSTFTIYVPPTPPLKITLVAPSGTEIWAAGSKQFITWSVTGGELPYSAVTLEYSTTGKTGTYTIITISATGSSYGWDIPFLPVESSDTFIRATVQDNKTTSAETTNDVSFTITVPGLPIITITQPNGGEVWGVNSKQNIQWTSNGGDGALTVKLKYTIQGFNGSYSELAFNLPATPGTWEWTIPNEPSGTCFIWALITDSYKGGARTGEDKSDVAFTIAVIPPPPSISVLSPASGVKWSKDVDYNIMWNRSGGEGPFTTAIDYTTDAKVTWASITSSASDAGGIGIYKWTVPNKPSLDCYIRITVTDGYSQDAQAISGQFEITNSPPPQIGSIDGTVEDENGVPIQGASIVVVERPVFHAVTNDKGYFIINSIPTGTYSIKASKADYLDDVRGGIAVTLNQITTISPNLVLATPPPPPTPMWIIIIAVVFVIIIVIGMMLGLASYYRRKARQEADKPPAVWVDSSMYAAYGYEQQAPDDPGARRTGTLPTESKPVEEEYRPVDKDFELQKLKAMRVKGMLSDEEYEFARNRLVEKDDKQKEILRQQEREYTAAQAPTEVLEEASTVTVQTPATEYETPTYEQPSYEKPTYEKPTKKKAMAVIKEEAVAPEPEASEDDLVELALARAGSKKKTDIGTSGETKKEELDILTLSELAKLEEKKRTGQIDNEEYEKKKKELRGGK